MDNDNTENNEEGSFELERVRWDGKLSSPIGKTPFGFFDTDQSFVGFAPRAADWAAKRLGYPIVDVEMIDVQFYACLEEAITEYSSQVNQFSIKQNLYSLKGTTTSVNLTTSVMQTQPLPFNTNGCYDLCSIMLIQLCRGQERQMTLRCVILHVF